MDRSRTEGTASVSSRPLLTVGHGARPAAAFVTMLQDAGVETLVDVRRFPGSRKHPQFGREAATTELAGHGIRYEWRGEELGGRRNRQQPTRHDALINAAFGGYADHMDTPQFRHAVIDLVNRSSDGEQLAIMCAETLWWRCHRSFVADALVCQGASVVHLLDVSRQQRHRTRATMRRADDGWPVYDVPDTLPLDQ